MSSEIVEVFELSYTTEVSLIFQCRVDANNLFEHPFFLDTLQRMTLISRSSAYLSCPKTSQTIRRYIPRAAMKLKRKIPQLLAYQGHWIDHLPNTITEDEKDELRRSYGRSFVQCVRYLRNLSQHFNEIGFDADAVMIVFCPYSLSTTIFLLVTYVRSINLCFFFLLLFLVGLLVQQSPLYDS